MNSAAFIPSSLHILVWTPIVCVHSVLSCCDGVPVRRLSAVSVRGFISCKIGPPEFHHESLLCLINGQSQWATTSTSSSTGWRTTRGSGAEPEVAVHHRLVQSEGFTCTLDVIVFAGCVSGWACLWPQCPPPQSFFSIAVLHSAAFPLPLCEEFVGFWENQYLNTLHFNES